MKQFVLEKITSLFIVVIGITIIAFLLGVLSPGDPAELALSKGGNYTPTPEQIASMQKEMGLDQPLHIQYISWLKNILKGNLGTSFNTNEKIADVISRKLPVTLKLATFSLVITCFFGILFGILSATFRDSPMDHIFKLITNALLSLPSFWIALLFILLFAEILGWLPTSGSDSFKHMILPALSLSLVTMASTIRFMRASMLKEYGKQYYLATKARGVSTWKLQIRNVLPNAILPILTMLGNFAGSILGGSAVIESIFALNGIGSYALESIRMKDYPALQFYVLLTGTIFVIVTLLVDLLSMLLNPQIRLGGSRHEA